MPTMSSEATRDSSVLIPAKGQAKNHTLLLIAFGVVYVVWGSTYLAIRVGIESFPPLLLAGTRHLSVGLLLYPILRWKTGIRPTAAHWKTAGISGCLLLLSNGGVCLSEETLPTGIAALLVATVSLWMVVVDWLRPGGLRPVPRVVAGLIFGFAGLALMVGPAHLGGSSRIDIKGAAILLIASLFWASGSVYAKHGTMPSSPMLGVSMQALSGGSLLWILSLITGELRGFHFAAVTHASWLAVGYLSVFGSMLGFTAYLYMLRESSATRVSTYAFVNPVVALFLGWLFIGEAITLRTLLAGLVILTAVLLVISAPQRKPELQQGLGAGTEA